MKGVRIMAKYNETRAYISIDGDIYEIHDTCHADQRGNERFLTFVDGDFLVHRMEILLADPQIADAIINGVRLGEEFILEDEAMGYSLAISHEFGRGYDYPTLVLKTVCQTLRYFDGEKVMRVFRNGMMQLYRWNRAARQKEVIAW